MKGVITPEQLTQALEEQRKTKEFLCTTIVRLGFATEDQVFPVLAKKLNIEYVKLKDWPVPAPSVLQMIPGRLAKAYKVIPLKFEANRVTLAMVDPLNADLVTMLSQTLGAGVDIKFVLASEADIRTAIDQHYQNSASPEADMPDISENILNDPVLKKIVNHVFSLGVEQQAVDIHTVQAQKEIKIRFKASGYFYEIAFRKNKMY